MKRISGRATSRESDVGVPGLLVSVYLADAAQAAPSRTSRTAASLLAERVWYRLGSVLTDDQGAFALASDERPAAGRPEVRSDLLLVVAAPDDESMPDHHVESELAVRLRYNIGDQETFVIGIDQARLAAAGIEVAGSDRETTNIVANWRSAEQRRETLRVESQRLVGDNLANQHRIERLADSKFETFMAALSAVPAAERLSPTGSYVPHGENVSDANLAKMRSGIRDRVGPAITIGAAALSVEQQAQMNIVAGQQLSSTASATLETYLRPNNPGRAPVLVRQTPLSFYCRPGPVEPCEQILQGNEPTEHDHGQNGTPVIPPLVVPAANGLGLAPADLPLLMANLLELATPPESPTIFSVHARADLDQIRQGVQSFALHSGPADAPALHDFHHLQIAFEHVWHELFDDDVVDMAKDLYTQLVEVGIDPNEYLFDTDEITLKFPTKKAKAASGGVGEPPASVISAFDIKPGQWASLSSVHRNKLESISTQLLSAMASIYNDKESFQPENDSYLKARREHVRVLRNQGEHIIGYATQRYAAKHTYSQYHEILEALAAKMKKPYRFSVYAANQFDRSVNFGIVATYRQSWEPLDYQVGRLVKTVPLAPKEVRRFTKKTVVRRTRAEKEVDNNLHARKSEHSETERAEMQIVQKALNKTNFQIGAQGGVNIGIASAKASTAFGEGSATESQEVKKEFREAVFKAAEEYRSERTVEINVSTSDETTLDESGEISNPNDEIPVTYLFYELQRRYRVSEAIHRLTPVVLVAQEFPKPSEIDFDWVVSNDWILRRVILDDSFIPAMNYVTSKIVGDEVSLQELFLNVEQQRRIVDEIKEEVVEIREDAIGRYAALQRSIEKRADAVAADNGDGFLETGVELLFGGSGADPDAARIREDAARDAYERMAKEQKDLQGRLERETTALNAITETYAKALSEHLNRRAQGARLLDHLKNNIMYYMQAIWSHEPPDQRFFRLHAVRVPKLTGKLTYTVAPDNDAIPEPPDWVKPHKLVVKCDLDPDLEFSTLEEAADLDNLLGFKGNYMMFPLRHSNALTDFMSIPYLDPIAGLRDPDPLGNWTIKDLVKYVCCLRETLSKAKFDSLRPGLEEAYRRLASAPATDGEEIVVPTDSLYIEALPGAHPILEDFKLYHRVVDVKRAQAEVRGLEFENLRMAARLLAGEREDPSIEKSIVIDGAAGVVIGDG
jgi:hypothetical protein